MGNQGPEKLEKNYDEQKTASVESSTENLEIVAGAEKRARPHHELAAILT
jgi:hypothetical protein